MFITFHLLISFHLIQQEQKLLQTVQTRASLKNKKNNKTWPGHFSFQFFHFHLFVFQQLKGHSLEGTARPHEKKGTVLKGPRAKTMDGQPGKMFQKKGTISCNLFFFSK